MATEKLIPLRTGRVYRLERPRRRSGLIAALRRAWRHVRGSIHGVQIIVALRAFRRQIGRPLMVVWNRLNAHRAKPVQDFLAAHLDDYHLEWLRLIPPSSTPRSYAMVPSSARSRTPRRPRWTTCTTSPAPASAAQPTGHAPRLVPPCWTREELQGAVRRGGRGHHPERLRRPRARSFRRCVPGIA
jgi:hypothetical protein